MEHYLSIGEVSKLLDIPESTLRFWQEKGLFAVSKAENSYRQYTVSDVIHIAEIAFYRNIGMPVKQMEHFSQFNLLDYGKILDNEKADLEAKLHTYQEMYEFVLLKTEHLKNIELLKNVDYLYDTVPFDRIVKFEYSDPDKLLKYTRNPSLYVRHMATQDLEHDTRGIITDQIAEDDLLLWQKKDSKQYAVFLIEEIPSENYANNISKKLEVIHQKHKTGILLANFLLGAFEGNKRIDYLKAYVELL